MTKLIAALIIVAALYCGWQLFSYWEKVKNGEEAQQKQDGGRPAITLAARPEMADGEGLRGPVQAQGGQTHAEWSNHAGMIAHPKD